MFIEILKENSVNKLYDDFIDEWELVHYRLIPKVNNCICGINIDKNFIIKNKLNNNELIVGSTCIKKFMKKEMHEIADKILRYEKFVNNNKETILESGKHKNKLYYDIFTNYPGYVEFISNNYIKDKNIKRFKKYCDYFNYLLKN